jgi:hypothetical protein
MAEVVRRDTEMPPGGGGCAVDPNGAAILEALYRAASVETK